MVLLFWFSIIWLLFIDIIDIGNSVVMMLVLIWLDSDFIIVVVMLWLFIICGRVLGLVEVSWWLKLLDIIIWLVVVLIRCRVMWLLLEYEVIWWLDMCRLCMLCGYLKCLMVGIRIRLVVSCWLIWVVFCKCMLLLLMWLILVCSLLLNLWFSMMKCWVWVSVLDRCVWIVLVILLVFMWLLFMV